MAYTAKTPWQLRNEKGSLLTKIAAENKAIEETFESSYPYLRWKEAVRIATTANGTFNTAFANGQAVDGVTIATGNRILIKNQTDAKQNGIYVVQASGAPVRATDADTAAELLASIVPVTAGTANADTTWVNTNTSIVIGTDNITFAAFGGLVAGTNLDITDNVISVDVDDFTTGQILAMGAAAIEDAGMTIEGTESTSWGIATDEDDGQIEIDVTGGGTDHTVTITNSVTTANRTITLPDATGTVVLADAEQILENKTLDEVVIGGAAKFMEIKSVDANSGALSGATGTITLAIPAGALLIGVTMNNDVATTDDDGNDTYTAAFSGGSAIDINGGSAIAAAVNTKTKEFIDVFAASAITDNTTNITLTPNGTNFTGGDVRAVVVYAEMVNLPSTS